MGLDASLCAFPPEASAQRFTFGAGAGLYSFKVKSQPVDDLYRSTNAGPGFYLSGGAALKRQVDLLGTFESSSHGVDYPNRRKVHKLGVGARMALGNPDARVRPFLYPELIWLSETVDDVDQTNYGFLPGTPLATCSDGRSLALTGGVDIRLKGRWSVVPAVAIGTLSQEDDCTPQQVSGHTLGFRVGLRHAAGISR